ncbi:MAG: bactofilin family protein [Planctomycetota bacterium]|jgi:cytoskeletal protein CcmA (bactofilin family)
MAEFKSGEIGTVLGTDAKFKGELTFDGAMRLEGRFDGKINSKGKLFIGKNAQLTAETAVGSLTIEGKMKGNVTGSERVELTASAQVMGDIRAPRLIVAEGATFVGNVNVSPDALKAGQTQTSQTAATTPKTTTETPGQRK